QRREPEQRGAGHQDPPPPEKVGDPAAEHQEAAVGDDVTAEHPLQALHGEVQVAGDGRERDVDDRRVGEVEEGDRQQEGEDEPAPAGGEEGRRCERWCRHVGYTSRCNYVISQLTNLTRLLGAVYTSQ